MLKDKQGKTQSEETKNYHVFSLPSWDAFVHLHFLVKNRFIQFYCHIFDLFLLFRSCYLRNILIVLIASPFITLYRFPFIHLVYWRFTFTHTFNHKTYVLPKLTIQIEPMCIINTYGIWVKYVSVCMWVCECLFASLSLTLFVCMY